STNGLDLLAGIATEIDSACGFAEEKPPGDYNAVLARYNSRLRFPHAARPLTLIIDALDQLAPGDVADDLAWIPGSLPPYVKMLVSCTRDVAGKLPTACTRLSIPRMPDAEGRELLFLWLADAGRTLTGPQERYILERFTHSATPLFLK